MERHLKGFAVPVDDQSCDWNDVVPHGALLIETYHDHRTRSLVRVYEHDTFPAHQHGNVEVEWLPDLLAEK